MEIKTPMQELIDSLVHQSNGCGQSEERYILSGVIDFAKELLEKEKQLLAKSEAVKPGEDELRNAFYAARKKDDFDGTYEYAIFSDYLSSLPPAPVKAVEGETITTEPTKEKYGWHEKSGFDDEPTGWMYEGGEDAYYEALNKWQATQAKLPVPVMQWVKARPTFTYDCILLTAALIRQGWDYSSWIVKRVEGEGGWYWGWFAIDGEEYGDIDDLKADLYQVIDLPKLEETNP